MAWIESHQSIARHPKTIRLARALGVSKFAAIGYLHMLWWWALDYAQDGDLSRYNADEIEAGAEWDGEPGKFLEALIAAGYVDEDLMIHDWYDYAGKLIEQREKDAERKREARARAKQSKKDVRQTSAGRPVDIQEMSVRTLPNQPNQPNQTNKEREIKQATSEIVRAYEEVCGPLRGDPGQLQTLVDYVDQGMDMELVIHAIRKSSTADHPAKYADAILRSYQRKGIRTLAEATAQIREKEGKGHGVHRTSDGEDAEWDVIEARFFGSR